jgi:hypothetical protein
MGILSSGGDIAAGGPKLLAGAPRYASHRSTRRYTIMPASTAMTK